MQQFYLFAYVFVFFFIALFVWLALKERLKYNRLRKTGIKAPGLIIANSEGAAKSFYRLGGNINHPVVKFVTEEGQEITGRPVMGYISQHEVRPLARVTVYYDPKQPKLFCIDL